MLSLHTVHRRAARVLPEVVQTSGVIGDAIQPDQLAALLFPLRRKSSGAIRFRLSNATADALGSQPMQCLRQATQARAALGRRREPFRYRPWRMVRVPACWLELAGAGHVAHASVEAYFTTKTDGKALVVVIPSALLAVYFWKD